MRISLIFSKGPLDVRRWILAHIHWCQIIIFQILGQITILILLKFWFVLGSNFIVEHVLIANSGAEPFTTEIAYISKYSRSSFRDQIFAIRFYQIFSLRDEFSIFDYWTSFVIITDIIL